MKRKQANEIVKVIYKKYENTIEFDKIESGNTFEEVYDLETLLPKKGHYRQYKEVYDELKELGVPLE
jgi:hypothetical protein